jgi:hypothetical protein
MPFTSGQTNISFTTYMSVLRQLYPIIYKSIPERGVKG